MQPMEGETPKNNSSYKVVGMTKTQIDQNFSIVSKAPLQQQ